MLNKNIYNEIISKKDFKSELLDMSKIEMKTTREGFGDALLALSTEHNEVVALCADLTESVQMHKFKNSFPDRFFEMGVAEQNMASVASGMAAMGKIPFIASYAMFNPGRNWEQIRTTICYNDRKVIIIGAHSGLSVGPDGGTHQALEDMAIMRAVPNMTIFSPCDYYEAYNMTKLAYNVKGPVYMRLTREKSPVIYNEDKIKLQSISTNNTKAGAGEIIFSSLIESQHKVGVVATGPIIFEALLAAKDLEAENIKVSILNVSTIKSDNFDINQVLNFAKNNNKKIITLEEHQVTGGLGSLICEILAEHYPSQVIRMGVQNRFGQSGTPAELYKEYNIDRESIKNKIRELVHSHI